MKVVSDSNLYAMRDGLWCAMYQEGHSVEKLSNTFGFSTTTINNALRNAEVLEDGVYQQKEETGGVLIVSILGPNTSIKLEETKNWLYANMKSLSEPVVLHANNEYLLRKAFGKANLPVPKYKYSCEYCFMSDNLLARYYGLCNVAFFCLCDNYLSEVHEKYKDDPAFLSFLKENSGEPDKNIVLIKYLNSIGKNDVEPRAWKKVEQIFKVNRKDIPSVLCSGNRVYYPGGQTFILYPTCFYSEEFRKSIRR